MLATVLGAILARTAALLGLLGRLLLATALGTTAAAGGLGFGYDGCGWGFGWGFGGGGECQGVGRRRTRLHN